MTLTKTARGAGMAIALGAVLALSACSSGPSTSPVEEDTTLPQATPVAPSATPEQTTAEANPDANAALDAYVALEAAQADTIMEAYGDIYSAYSVEPEYPNTVVFTYTFKEALDPEAAAEALESQVDTVDSTCQSVVFPAMEAQGVTPTQQAMFVYLNPDGSELWSHSVSSEDA
ncbi:DUF4854 domain-containing protein [Demequina sp.]|uniref:DUF4854 domain-containing protein n=1 Tax=Demequina sp. TaxID=2050685 RepID=UPI003D0A82E6